MANNIVSIERRDSDLYFNGRLIVFPNGEQLLERDLISYESKQPDVYHTVMQGDRITSIAARYYGAFTENPAQYWKYIADVNNIENPLDISAYIGKNIIIPNFYLIRLVE